MVIGVDGDWPVTLLASGLADAAGAERTDKLRVVVLEELRLAGVDLAISAIVDR
jgi:hypothetical protein